MVGWEDTGSSVITAGGLCCEACFPETVVAGVFGFRSDDAKLIRIGSWRPLYISRPMVIDVEIVMRIIRFLFLNRGVTPFEEVVEAPRDEFNPAPRG